MIKGGYKIIDLKWISISATGVKIPGIHNEIESNYHKPLLLSGINIEGLEMADVYVTASSSGGTYSIPAYNGIISITSEDEVTFTANA